MTMPEGGVIEREAERIDLVVTLDGGRGLALRPRSVVGVEEVGTPFRYEVVARAALRRGLVREIVGRKVELTLRGDGVDADGSTLGRSVFGLVSEAFDEATDADDDVMPVTETEASGVLRLVVSPLAYPATLGRGRHVYRDLDARAIIRRVLGRAGVAYRDDARRGCAVRKYTVQQDESDWAFVLRLCEEEGLYTWFDHELGSILVVAERSSAAPRHTRGGVLARRSASGLGRTALAVSEVGPIGRVRPQRIALASFDPDRPSLGLAAATGPASGLEVYDAPGSFVRDPAELRRWAEMLRERAAVEAHAVAGDAALPHLSPGRQIVIDGHGEEGPEGDLFITRIEISLTAARVGRSADGADEAPMVRFEGVPIQLPFRLARRMPVPRQPGLAIARVVGVGEEEIDLDGGGHARAHHHWDRHPDAASPGRWMRVVQRGTGGSMLLPRVGWNVHTMASEGSIDEPTIVARVVDAEHMPPYSLPAQKTRVTYQTPSSPGGGNSNEIHFEDTAGGEVMFVHASRDMTTDVGKDRSDTVKGNAKRVVQRDQRNDVRSTRDEHVDLTDTLSIGNDWIEKVDVDFKNTVKGAQATKIGGTRTLSTGQNHKLSAQAGRDLKVGAAMLDVTLGAVKSVSPIQHVLVGGAAIKASPRDLAEKVGSEVDADMVLGRLPAKVQGVLKMPFISGAMSKLTAKLKKSVGMAIQTVGAMKIEKCVDRKLEVDGALLETCGPTTWVTAKFTETSHGAMTIKAAKLTAKAVDKITIQSDEKVTLQVGGTVLEVTPTSVKLAAKSLQLDKATATSLTGAAVYVNAKGAPSE
jgi:type VI secretion system secreted protein VgrG